MSNYKTILRTDRIYLRPFQTDDASAIQDLAGAREIAENTFVPHPYEDGKAEDFIKLSEEKNGSDQWANFAIILKKQDQLIGSIGYKDIDSTHQRAEFGYWIGKPYWNKGYATEAVNLLVAFGFEELNLHRIYATPFGFNIASQRVLKKAGMKKEGVLKDHIFHFGKFKDLVFYGLTVKDYQKL